VSRQFKRSYSLTLSDGTKARTITGLRVSFEIKQSLLSFPNLAKIEIYNPNQDSLSIMQKRYSELTFNAGYAGNLRLLFKGQIRNVFQKKVGADRIVTLFAGDGERDWQNSTFNKTLSENTTIKQVINKIAQSFTNTSIGILQGVDVPADKLRGQTLSGPSKDILDKLAEDYGFQWSIQDGDLTVVPNQKTLDGLDVVLINQATGMVGSPTITQLGVNVTTLLNPDLVPNRAFQVQSTSANVAIGGLQFREIKRTSGEGLYKTFQVTFIGDTYGPSWFSTVEGRAVNA